MFLKIHLSVFEPSREKLDNIEIQTDSTPYTNVILLELQKAFDDTQFNYTLIYIM